MKPSRLLLASLALAACDDPPPASVRESPAFPERPPVISAPPVQTIPFEEGYALGFARGRSDGRPKASVPGQAAAEALAVEAAAAEPARAEKWRSGWVAGYLDGFRQVATGAK